MHDDDRAPETEEIPIPQYEWHEEDRIAILLEWCQWVGEA